MGGTVRMTVAARGLVNGRGPPLAVGGIGTKFRSLRTVPSVNRSLHKKFILEIDQIDLFGSSGNCSV